MDSIFDRVKREANGRWATILSDLSPRLVPALTRPGTTRIACPVHGSGKGSKGDGFRVFDDFASSGGGVCNTCGARSNGIELLAWLEDMQPLDAAKEIENYLGLKATQTYVRERPSRRPPAPVPPEPAHKKHEVEKRKAVLQEIWGDAVPLADLADDHQALRYLHETRKIPSLAMLRRQEQIRFHPKLFYRDEGSDTSQWLPGLVSMFHSSDGHAIALHRTYLDPSEPRKASVALPKKMLRRLDVRVNGAVQLYGQVPFDHHVNICEGIETGLSVAYAIGRPVLAATTATLMGSWNPILGTRFVTIWADLDRAVETPLPNGGVKTSPPAGLVAATRLQQSLTEQGIKSRILMPQPLTGETKADWADILTSEGFESLVGAYQGRMLSKLSP